MNVLNYIIYILLFICIFAFVLYIYIFIVSNVNEWYDINFMFTLADIINVTEKKKKSSG